MRSFFISLRSEFFKSRNTLAFWAAILIPIAICGLVALGFFFNIEKLVKANLTAEAVWRNFTMPTLSIMGLFILPFYVLFTAFSVNNIEHKNDTWKTIFSLPLNKFSVYAAKYVYGALLIALSLLLFCILTYLSGALLGLINEGVKFNDASPLGFLFSIYLRIFLSSLGIYSLQFVMSLFWSDFLKPMGIGFVIIITGIITITVGWEYSYLIPYTAPFNATTYSGEIKSILTEQLPIFTKFVGVSLSAALAGFIAGYYILSARNIK